MEYGRYNHFQVEVSMESQVREHLKSDWIDHIWAFLRMERSFHWLSQFSDELVVFGNSRISSNFQARRNLIVSTAE